MPDLISLPRQVLSRGHPVFSWIPASAGMTACATTYDVLYAFQAFKEEKALNPKPGSGPCFCHFSSNTELSTNHIIQGLTPVSIGQEPAYDL